MSRDLIVGVDAGTSVIKAVAFDSTGAEIAAVGRPNAYVDLPGGGVEQDMTRTWDDTAAVLRDLAQHVPELATRILALAVTGQGDGTWLIDAEGEPVAPAWLWLDSRAAAIVRELDRTGARAIAYRCTGCGMNACNQSAHLVWLKRHAPHLLARTATACHCKDWLYFKLTGERVTDTSEGTFTFGDFRTRAYEPEVLDALGLTAERELLPPMIDGSRARTRCRRPPRRPASPKACRWRWAISTCCARVWGPASTSRAGRRLLDRRLDRHAHALRAGRAVAPPGAEPSGYTMPFPVPGSVTQMQSNMAATLNIDWLRGPGAGSCRAARASRSTARPRWPRSIHRVLEAKPAQLSTTPISTRRANAGRSSTSTRGRSSPGCPCAWASWIWCGRSSKAWPSPRVIATRPWAMCPRRSASPAAPRAPRR